MQGIGFAMVFPLSFLAGTFVPIKRMAAVPRDVCQGTKSTGSWPLEHPVRGDDHLVGGHHRQLRPARATPFQDDQRGAMTRLPAGPGGQDHLCADWEHRRALP